MTAQTPIHVQRALAPGQRHPVDAPVTRRATDTFVDVDTMVEINEARKIVNPGPLDRLIIAKTIAHGRQYRAIGPDLIVAIHTGFGGRNAGERAVFHRCVAVAAVDAVVADVVLVAEGHRLAAGDAYFGDIRRFIDCRQRGHQRDHQNDAAENADFRKGIGTGMEYLAHSSSIWRKNANNREN